MSASLVDLDRLTKRFGAVRALSDVSFHVREGEVLGLIGPNGAGKTTLMECVAGLLPYDAGVIRVSGRVLPRGTSSPDMFYLPDAIAPWPSETVRWALAFAAGFFGGRSEAIDETVARLGLEPLLDSRIGTLSKGQRKRAMLAIGLLVPHPVLLCDEPFDGLDLRQTREIGAALRAHAAAGRTLLLSIHQISDAARICDRFVLLSAGRVRGEGTVSDLADRAPGSTPDSLEEIFLALT
jgi:ABC-type multidrug transport system ATPase subunit